jgi:transcriptional regulator with XRE-family HTH domain
VKTEELFRLARVLQAIKQRDIARKVDITHSALSSYEAGRYTLSRATLRRIAPLLNINPDFLDDQSVNPFKSKDLIKMFFNEQMFAYIIIEPLNVLIAVNKQLKFISMISNIDLFSKAVGNLSLFQKPIYAIAVKDQDDNVFLLRRKSKAAYIKIDGAFY